MRKIHSGFTLIELIIVLMIAVYIIFMGGVAYKRYEEPHRLRAAAQTLLMDLKLQQQKARAIDSRRGVYFTDNSTYSLGYTDTSSTFVSNQVPRTVHLSSEFRGITVSSIEGSATFPKYVYFDPFAADGTTWAPYNTSFSSYPGQIVLHCSSKDAIISICKNGEITVQYK